MNIYNFCQKIWNSNFSHYSMLFVINKKNTLFTQPIVSAKATHPPNSKHEKLRNIILNYNFKFSQTLRVDKQHSNILIL